MRTSSFSTSISSSFHRPKMADVLARVERSLQLLVLETQALNSATVASIDHTPTALEFSTFVTSNRPLVVRDQGQRDGIRALGWTNSFLERVLQGRKVSVAVDPTG
jgi:jumonji domain-containing protein 7